MGELSIVFEVFKAFGPIGVLIFLWWKERAEKDELKNLANSAINLARETAKTAKEATNAIHTSIFVNGKTLEAVGHVERSMNRMTQEYGQHMARCPLADLGHKEDA